MLLSNKEWIGVCSCSFHPATSSSQLHFYDCLVGKSFRNKYGNYCSAAQSDVMLLDLINKPALTVAQQISWPIQSKVFHSKHVVCECDRLLVMRQISYIQHVSAMYKMSPGNGKHSLWLCQYFKKKSQKCKLLIQIIKTSSQNKIQYIIKVVTEKRANKSKWISDYWRQLDKLIRKMFIKAINQVRSRDIFS